MRDILVIGIVLSGSIYALRYPWFGVMLWTWVSLMNPHSLAFGFAQSFPVAATVAIATMIGLAVAKERRSAFMGSPPIWLTLFMIWICIAFPFSFSVTGSSEMLSKVLKVDLMILVSLMLISTRQHIDWFVWVVAMSLGFYGIKGGVFTIATGGNFRVWGPGGFVGGNNEIALALIVIIPLLRYLQLQAANKWVRRGLSAAMLLTATAALGSQSRGALLAIAAMGFFLWLKSPKKIVTGLAIAIITAGVVAFMPDTWTARMNTIQTYEDDASAMGRINAWWTAFNVAKTHVTGAGFDMYNYDIFSRFAPVAQDVHAAHSIYFQVMGEQGFIGLFLFIGIWWSVWRTASWLVANSGQSPETLWCKHLGAMCQVSLVGYLVGGAFLSLAYFDLPYDILVIVVAARQWVLGYQEQRPSEKSSLERDGQDIEVVDKERLGFRTENA